MDKVFDVVALGEGLIEFNQTHATEPVYLQGFGGDTSNAIIAASRAGAHCAYLSRVGSDAFGQALRALWADSGIDTQAVESDPAHPTGIYFVSHGEQGHSFSYLRAGSAASRMTADWLEASKAAGVLASSRILHVSGISMAISGSACDTVFAAMTRTRASGTLVSFDVNLRLKLWPLERARACIKAALSMADIVIPSLEDVAGLCSLTEPDAIVDWCHGLGAAKVVLKLGPKGALVSDGRHREHIPGHRVNVVDATGAGDCFSGNLLARMARGETLFEAARYANAAAALAVQGFGAVPPLPGPEAVRTLL
jgi:2-dehydro-3-deoxygluconokinase